jgi:hypothetical protein
VVEKADVAEQDQPEAVPAIYEAHRSLPLVPSAESSWWCKRRETVL